MHYPAFYYFSTSQRKKSQIKPDLKFEYLKACLELEGNSKAEFIIYIKYQYVTVI